MPWRCGMMLRLQFNNRVALSSCNRPVIVSKSLYPLMIDRLRDFSASEKYKVPWLASWMARRTLYRFLSNRCSKEFLVMYLEQAPDILDCIAEPGMSLSFSPEVNLVVRLHAFGLLPETFRRKFVETVSNYAIEGDDVSALDDSNMRKVFTEDEHEELVRAVRTDLLPKLGDVRRNAQSNYDPSKPPDEHMQNLFESFSTLKSRFIDDDEAIKIIEEETALANDWISETETPEPKISPRVLGELEPSEKKYGTRSVFDDIDESDV